MPIRTPSAARRRARALEREMDDPTGARKAAQLNRWAVQLERARRINEDENPDDAELAWGAVDDARQQLGDLGVEVAGEQELRRPETSPANATPAARAATGKRSGRGGAARPSSARRGSSSSRGRQRKGPVRRSIDAVSSSLPGGGPGIGDLVMEAIAATVGLAILLRLIDASRGGPQIVSALGAGVSNGLRLLVNPIDPLNPSGTVTATTAPASSSSSSSTAPASSSSASAATTAATVAAAARVAHNHPASGGG